MSAAKKPVEVPANADTGAVTAKKIAPMGKAIVLKPLQSEKTYGISSGGVYVFGVDKAVNKQEIAKAVEKVYGVTVVAVRTANAKGKVKRLYKNRKYEVGSRTDVRKAYVSLKDGDQIPIFAAVEEAEAEAEKAEKKAAKREAKQSAAATTSKETSRRSGGFARRILRQNKSGER